MAAPERPTRLFLLSTGQDTGGFGWRLFSGFRDHAPGWEAHTMAATRTYIAYPEDLRYNRERLLEHYAAADVVHLQNQTAGWDLYDDGAGKPTILQHHGTIFREGHEWIAADARRIGMVQVCSTLDLTLLEPDVTWLPVPYDLAELQAIRRTYHQPDGIIRVAHAPTNRRVKDTELFLEVMHRIEARRPNVRTVLIERQTWSTCLRRKATADIFYDQLDLGYGCNAVEAWGMGLPVIAGATDPAVRALMRERWGSIPYVAATVRTLERVLERLIESEQARREAAERGREHFDRWHDERVVVPMWQQVYATAPQTSPGPALLRPRAIRSAQRREARTQAAAAALARALARRERLRSERAG